MLEEKLDYYSDKFVEQGEIKKAKKIAKNMLACGIDIKEIAELTELPLKTIKALQAKPNVA